MNMKMKKKVEEMDSGQNIKHFVLLPIVAAVTLFLWFAPHGFYGSLGEVITVTQQRTIAIFAFAALMWIFEIVPNWVTSLIVIVISLLTISDRGLGFAMQTADDSLFMSSKELMRAFSDPVVMLFLGGFVLAIAGSKYGMDVQIARALLKPFGRNPKFVILGFLCIIAVFSMFMSDTATAAVFLSFLAPVLKALPDDDKGRTGLALAIPLASNIGGIGTPIGTPPNATAVGVLENNGISIPFAEWSLRMIPFVMVMILVAWFLLRIFFPSSTKEINIVIPKENREKTWRDYVARITFGLTILLWMTESLHGLSSSVVALIPLAVFTATGVFTKDDISKINWSILWLVAGGFALGYAMNDTGLARSLMESIDFASMKIVAVFAGACLICYLLSNFISNSATAALLIPIMVALGKGLLQSSNAAAFAASGGQKALAVFVAMCASLAMCLPISTPSNAMASSTGLVNTHDMAKVGIIIGVTGIVLGFFWVTKIAPFPQ